MRPGRVPAVAALLAASLARAAVLESETYAPTSRGAFLSHAFLPRAAGLAGAVTSAVDDPSAVFWNPAGLGALDGSQVLAAHDVLGDDVGITSAALAAPVGAGVAGLGAAVLTAGALTPTDAAGRAVAGVNSLDAALTLGWARPGLTVFDRPAVAGAGLDLVREAFGGTLVGLNAGALLRVTPALMAGCAVLHLGSAALDRALAARARAGAAWDATPRLRLVADLGWLVPERTWSAAAGCEVRPGGSLTLRAGYTRDGTDGAPGPLTGLGLGLGARAGGLWFDYGYQPFGDVAGSHTIAVRFAFAPRPAAAPPASAVPAAPVPADVAPPRHVAAESEAETRNTYESALVLFRAGNYDAAIASLQILLRGAPRHWQAWQLLGHAYQAKHDTKSALRAYRRSLDINPANAALKSWLAELERQEKEAP